MVRDMPGFATEHPCPNCASGFLIRGFPSGLFCEHCEYETEERIPNYRQ